MATALFESLMAGAIGGRRPEEIGVGARARETDLDINVRKIEYWMDTNHDWKVGGKDSRMQQEEVALHLESQRELLGSDLPPTEAVSAAVLQKFLGAAIDPEKLALDLTRKAITLPVFGADPERLASFMMPNGAPTMIPVQFICPNTLLSDPSFYKALSAIAYADSGGAEVRPLQVCDVEHIEFGAAQPARVSVGGFHSVDSGTQPKPAAGEEGVLLRGNAEDGNAVMTVLPTGAAKWTLGRGTAEFTFQEKDKGPTITMTFAGGLVAGREMVGLPMIAGFLRAYREYAAAAAYPMSVEAFYQKAQLAAAARSEAGPKMLKKNPYEMAIATALHEALKEPRPEMRLPVLFIQRALEALKFCGDDTLTEIARVNKATLFTTVDFLTWCMAIKKGIPCCVFIANKDMEGVRARSATVWYSYAGAGADAAAAAEAEVARREAARAQKAARAEQQRLMEAAYQSLCATVARLLADARAIFSEERANYPRVIATAEDPTATGIRTWLWRLEDTRDAVRRLTDAQAVAFVTEAAAVLVPGNVRAAEYEPLKLGPGQVYIKELNSTFELLRNGPAAPGSRAAVQMFSQALAPRSAGAYIQNEDKMLMIVMALQNVAGGNPVAAAILTKYGLVPAEAEALMELAAATERPEKRQKTQRGGGGDEDRDKVRHEFCERYVETLARMLRTYIYHNTRTAASVAAILNLRGTNVDASALDGYLAANPDALTFSFDTDLTLLRYPAAALAGPFYVSLFLRGFGDDGAPNWSTIRHLTYQFLSEQGYDDREEIVGIATELTDDALVPLERAVEEEERANAPAPVAASTKKRLFAAVDPNEESEPNISNVNTVATPELVAAGGGGRGRSKRRTRRRNRA